jgi:AmmeMemoRadiSam system protein A
MHPLIKLAKDTIERYIRSGETMPVPEELTDEMKERRGTFVSLKKRGILRGCIGTISPSHSNVAEEIIINAISAATKDPRFPPVTRGELDDLNISVDVLSEAEKISDMDQLDPKRYGVIVTSGWKKGLLLPDIEGVNSVEEQIEIAKEKAGIRSDEDVEIMRFEVKRYKGS